MEILSSTSLYVWDRGLNRITGMGALYASFFSWNRRIPYHDHKKKKTNAHDSSFCPCFIRSGEKTNIGSRTDPISDLSSYRRYVYSSTPYFFHITNENKFNGNLVTFVSVPTNKVFPPF
jgi:hypothetical protein